MIKSKGRKGRRGEVGASRPVAVPGPPDLAALSWRELVSHASDRGVLKAGMTKAQVLKALGA